MTKMKRLMVTVAAAAGLLTLVTAPQAMAAPPSEGAGVAVSSLDGVKLIPAKLNAGKAGARVAQQDAFLIESALSGRCWDADPGTINQNGTRMQLWDCDVHSAYQAFYITRNPQGYLRFQNVQSGRYLDASMSSIGHNGTKVQLWVFEAGAKNQWWADTVNPQGYVRLQSPASGRYLTAEGQVGGNATRLQLWDFIGSARSQWWQ